ncbi:amidase family protein [Pseudomonas sp. R5-89-07]|uniref:amidase family protein n=1 Tax=Pseudomonas sp. R5-89-07 TaxID=658644 RepID=UPI000F6C84B8|nr:amidase family protein [Pseudomonas sp. R5-89-07]AZF06923.1 Aspartyl-tRNA(Asn) amidotransferase subunit A [Pseudomonas sp. R5-89-07]
MIGPFSAGGWATGLFQALSNPPQGFKGAFQMAGEMTSGGGVTSELLVKDAFRQIANIDRGLQGGNAFIETNPDALKDARARDAERKKGHVRGYLHGVPIALKDVFETKDRMQTSAGSKALVGQAATKNARVVDNLLKAGAVVVGKTNMSELSNFRSELPADGWSSRGGQTLNPHRLGGVVAGSSSGSAVAVAQGHVPLALGVETSGSVIAPAAYNGVIGLKTSVGLLSNEGVMTSTRMDTIGTFTRNVCDAAEALNAMAETSLYSEGLRSDALKGKRIGYTPVPELSEAEAKDPAKRADSKHYADALEVLRSQGAILVPLGSLEEDVGEETYAGYNEALFSDVKHQLEEYLAGREGLPVKSLTELIAFNKRHQKPGEPDQKLLKLISGLETTQDQRDKLWEAVIPVFQKTIDDPIKEHKLDAMVSNFLSNNYFFSAAAGYPGMSIPSGMDEEGMPTALYIYGSANSEATLLSAAYVYEQATQAIKEPAFLPGTPFMPAPVITLEVAEVPAG